MNKREQGIQLFRHRIVFGVRDTVLREINSIRGTSKLTGVPETELGALADLSADQRASIACFVAHAIDLGLHSFLHGLDDEPDDLQVRYDGTVLNEDGMYYLGSHDLPPFADLSMFDENGAPKQT